MSERLSLCVQRIRGTNTKTKQKNTNKTLLNRPLIIGLYSKAVLSNRARNMRKSITLPKQKLEQNILTLF